MGRLVLATVHASSRCLAGERYINLGVPAYLIDEVLIGVLQQAVVKPESENRRRLQAENLITASAHVVIKAADVTDTPDLALDASGCDRATVMRKPRLLSELPLVALLVRATIGDGSSYVAADLADHHAVARSVFGRLWVALCQGTGFRCHRGYSNADCPQLPANLLPDKRWWVPLAKRAATGCHPGCLARPR